ncbi:hypothetical protein Chor_000098 [Crotalus horridus]
MKEQEKELEKIEIVTRDDVEKAMMAKWQYIKDQEKLIREFFRISLEEAKDKIDKNTLRQLELKKEWATENAVKHIDKISRREIKEYEWLKEEVS